MRLSSPSALPTASNRRNADFLRVSTLSSPPLHAATAHASSPRKRTRPPSPPQAHKPKQKRRARVTVDPDETTQVTGQDRYKLPLADADAYYFPDFVDPRTAQHWHDQLLNLEEWYRPTLKVYGKPVTQSRKIAAFATDPSLDVKYSGTTVRMSYDYPPLLREIQDLVEAKLDVKFNHVMLNLYENGQIYIGNHRDNRENRVIASLSLGAPRTFILTHDKPLPPLASSSSLSLSSASLPKAAAKKARAAARSKSATTLPTSPSLPSGDAAPIKDDADQGAFEQVAAADASSSNSAPPPPPSLVYSHRFTLENGSLVVMQGTMQQHWKHQIPKEKLVTQSRISLTFRQLVF
ncbi:hypothetical protein JCM8115_006985 [Rhodotorula mucilaginosa]